MRKVKETRERGAAKGEKGERASREDRDATSPSALGRIDLIRLAKKKNASPPRSIMRSTRVFLRLRLRRHDVQ